MDFGYPMPSPRKRVKGLLFSACLVISAIALVTKAALSMPTGDWADLLLIKSSIIAYNAEDLKKSLSDDSYRGEEGILRIRPEVARSLGLNVFIDPDYLKAKELYRRAEELLGKTVEAMKAQKKQKLPGEHVQKVCETAILYNKTLESAQRHMAAYRASLTPGTDDRLNKGICSELLEKLFRECLTGASHNLREALGCFYNKCKDLDGGRASLNPQNVEFVNHVFRELLEKAGESAKKLFDLDRVNQDQEGGLRTDYGSGWKHVVGDAGSDYVALLEPVLEDEKKAGYSVDPLLIFALIRQESNFDPRAVSDVGAVGLTQIMPETAKDLGMITIFMPEYLDEAKSFMGKERRLKRQAMALIREITNESMLESAGKARQRMQESLDLGRRWKRLYTRYKQELLGENDDRLDPVKAIKHGLRYFATMMRMHEGDISLALAAYNAGPHRVKQYGGIPPFAETILFRNNVLGYYRDYQLKLEKTGTP
jgi:soluble lytic murein transglycosylase-like protein